MHTIFYQQARIYEVSAKYINICPATTPKCTLFVIHAIYDIVYSWVLTSSNDGFTRLSVHGVGLMYWL